MAVSAAPSPPLSDLIKQLQIEDHSAPKALDRTLPPVRRRSMRMLPHTTQEVELPQNSVGPFQFINDKTISELPREL